MGVEDVSRSEAVSLGLIKADDPPPEMERRSMNDGLEAEVPFNEYSDEWKNLKKSFGSQIQIRGRHIRWNEGVIQALLHGEKAPSAQLGKGEFNPELLRKIPDASLREEIRGRGLTITRQWIETHGRRHRDPSGKGGLNLPLTGGDYSLIPAMWRSPDSVTVDKRGWLALHLETLDGGVLTLGVHVKTGQPTTFRKEKGLLHDDRE